MFDTS